MADPRNGRPPKWRTSKLADQNRKYNGQDEDCRTHVYLSLDARTLHVITYRSVCIVLQYAARLPAYTLTTYKYDSERDQVPTMVRVRFRG